MKNRLKGLTLLETVLYIGLFSIIILIVLNFMLSTQEATLRTQRKASLHQSSQFIIQHITDSFEDASSVDPTISRFNESLGKISLIIDTQSKSYELLDSRLLFDNTYISSPDIVVESFLIEPVYKGEDNIIGVKSTIQIRSTLDSRLEETINLLSIIR